MSLSRVISVYLLGFQDARACLACRPSLYYYDPVTSKHEMFLSNLDSSSILAAQ